MDLGTKQYFNRLRQDGWCVGASVAMLWKMLLSLVGG
jgi:hypothetical protein